MSKLRHIAFIVKYNFSTWKKNPRIILTFVLAFVMCYLLCNKVLLIAEENGTYLQFLEPFIWTFSDSTSILIMSLLLLMLLGDLPITDAATPYYLYRIKRSTWVIGQILYAFIAAVIYILSLLLFTSLICIRDSFINNYWSETAALLGYSGGWKKVNVSVMVKTLEMSFPVQCAATIIGLMILYVLFLTSVFLLVNLFKDKAAGTVSVFVISVYGLIVNPNTFNVFLNLDERKMYIVNLIAAWTSPLAHATYDMHNFGYDLLPKIWTSATIFGCAILLCIFLALKAARHYDFYFTDSNE